MKKRDKNQVMINNEAGMIPAKKKKKRKKAPIIIGIIVIIFVLSRLASCALASAPTALVSTTKVTRGQLQDSVNVTGTVESQEKKIVFANVSGKVELVNVGVGDSVKSGDILVSYNMDAMDMQLKQAQLQQSKSTASYNSAMANNSENQAKLNEANTNLGVLEQQLTDYNKALENLQNGLSDNQRNTSNGLATESFNLTNQASQIQTEMQGLSKDSQEYAEKAKQLEEIQNKQAQIQLQQQLSSSSDYVADTQKKIAEIQKHIAECEEYKMKMESQKASSEAAMLDAYDKEIMNADKELSEMSYQQTEEDYNAAKAGICAEFDGVITECSVIPGSMITEGMQLFTLENTDLVKITFSVTKNEVAKLEVGQKAVVTIFNKEYDGEVAKINRMATANMMSQTATPMVGVEVNVLNPDDNIILGLDAKVEIYTQKAEDALLVPVEAINADKKGDFVYVVENGVIVRKDIVCGISTNTHTEVLEGITETDAIVLTTYTEIEEGMTVTVMPDTMDMADIQAMQAE